MTANRIKEIALSHFARFGYEGASLGNIASEVGIKKPSIYAHFKGKEELFFICLEESLAKDIDYFRNHALASESTPFKAMLHQLLTGYANRFQENEEAMFWLRSAYFPPAAFRDQIVLKANQHIENIGAILRPLFQEVKDHGILREMETNDALEAYMCLFDGLMVELLFEGFDRFERRLAASWKVYWHGVSKQSR
ncbi:TetR/AcrR family transcriptional regulator [Paenibacillus chungangensis]|uniref:TetR/AcrR family transcriptional regulator n=1 Tax=Paenibacillus chungangensis TaxID=696535 RepID=A0ABW3HQ39_9BACL